MPRRSPIILWLLLVANVCFDAILLSWATSQSDEYFAYAALALQAMVQGQLCVVCIWAAVTASKSVWTLLLPFLAALCAALMTATATSRPATFNSQFVSHSAYFGLHAALLVAALWLFRRTTFWRRRTGVALAWQYSMGHLLFVMTIVALLAVTFRQEPLAVEGGWDNIIFVGSSVALAVASLFLWSLSWHWILRLAAVLAVAMALACLLVLVFTRGRPGNVGTLFMMIFGSHHLIQGIVLSVWLGVSPLLPAREPCSTES